MIPPWQTRGTLCQRTISVLNESSEFLLYGTSFSYMGSSFGETGAETVYKPSRFAGGTCCALFLLWGYSLLWLFTPDPEGTVKGVRLDLDIFLFWQFRELFRSFRLETALICRHWRRGAARRLLQ